MCVGAAEAELGVSGPASRTMALASVGITLVQCLWGGGGGLGAGCEEEKGATTSVLTPRGGVAALGDGATPSSVPGMAANEMGLVHTTAFTQGTWTLHLVHRGIPAPKGPDNALKGPPCTFLVPPVRGPHCGPHKPAA